VDIISGLNNIVVAAGFDEFTTRSAGSLEYEASEHIITGNDLEQLLANRGKNEIFSHPPFSVGFIQCFGSRDIKEKAAYCSRVCCGYSIRAAKVLREYYPDIKITFFYMDFQEVEGQEYFDDLLKDNIEFVRCRPVSIKAGKPNVIVYEHPEEHRLVERSMDLLILSEGIYPSDDFEDLAEICMLGLNENGFMKYVKDPMHSGIYLAGCAAGPKRIEEVYAESLQVAREICGGIS
jgi:heterodisulfide reductase subunit A